MRNDLINSMVWNAMPKNIFVAFDALELGGYETVAYYMIPADAAVNICSEINLKAGEGS